METEAGSAHDGAEANRSNPSSVCAVCQGFGEEGHPRRRVLRHWNTVRSPYMHVYFHLPYYALSESARNGCKVCTQFGGDMGGNRGEVSRDLSNGFS